MRRAAAAASRCFLRIEELLSRTLLALLVLLVFVPAVTRTFNQPIIWSIEIAQLLFAWLAFLGANQAMRAGAHIGVDVLTRHLPPRLRRAVALFNLGLIAAFLAALLWYGVELTFVSVDRRFMTTNLSFAFATVAAPLGAALLLASTVGRAAAALRSGVDDDEGGGEERGGEEGREDGRGGGASGSGAGGGEGPRSEAPDRNGGGGASGAGRSGRGSESGAGAAPGEDGPA